MAIIALDLDNVIRPLTSLVVVYYNENREALIKEVSRELVDRDLRLSDCKQYNAWETWGGDQDAAVEIFQRFYESDIFRNTQPLPGAIDFIRGLRENEDEVIIITSSYEGHDRTMDWIRKNIGSVFDGDVYFIHEFSGENRPATKAEVCREIGAIALVDDYIGNLIPCLEIPSLIPILFNPKGQYGWNTYRVPDTGIIEVQSFERAAQVITEMRLRGGVEVGY